MVWDPLLDASALEQAAAIRTGRVSSEALVRLYLERISRHNPALTAFVQVAGESALRSARRKDALTRRGGELPAFHGVPIGIKDLNLVRGMRTRFGSRAFPSWLWSPIDDHVVARIRGGGFVILGKLAASEMGAMPVTEPDIHEPVKNPFDLQHSAGGSSGGSGAAVAAYLLPLAHASDGAGSIRIPASFGNLVGLKPSRGRITNQFGIGDRRILYTCGPLARSVDDAAAMLDVMASGVVGRTTWAPPPARPFAALAREAPGPLRIRLVLTSPFGRLDEEIEAIVRDAARSLEGLGHRVDEAPLLDASLDEFLPLWQALVGGVPLPASKLQPVTRWLYEAGRKLKTTDVARLHDDLHQRVTAWFGDADAVLSPTGAVPPPRVGAYRGLGPRETFEAAAVLGALTAPFNVTGQPAMSIPGGFTRGGLPVGVQLAGRPFGEGTLLALARTLEEILPARRRRAPLVERDRDVA